MLARVKSWWFGLQYTLWFIPAIMTIVALLLANLTLYVDRQAVTGEGFHAWWVFEGGAEGARGVLSTIAGTMITVATTAFSITIVAIQLGSSQYSPRILHGFTGDRGNQLVLGTFIATFAYTVLVLRSVRSETADQVVFVPALSVTVSIVLAFVAIGSLIYFFHHATRTIQASAVIERAAEDTFGLIDDRLSDGNERTDEGVIETVERHDMVPFLSRKSGYVSAIDVGRLAEVGSKHGVVISLPVQVGMHLLSNTPVAQIPNSSLANMEDNDRESLGAAIRAAISIGMERTLEHDLLLGFRQLSDIAVKALSPGINDPTTAVTAIDRMGEALLRVRETSSTTVFQWGSQKTGGVRFETIGLQNVLDESIPQIRHFGASDVMVMMHLLKVLGMIADGASTETKVLLEDQAQAVVDESTATLTLAADQARVRQAAKWMAREGEPKFQNKSGFR